MPVLDFKGKSTVYSHHLGVPFRPLEIDEKKSLPKRLNNEKKAKSSLDDNLIIHGDNLHALKTLLPKYAGKVKCIYIDPPYNTGNEEWAYNDNVNNPMIKEWFKKVVDTDDLEKHDKWLCMMWPRLHLLKELLSDDGVIFISIDDNESANLKLLCDEIFGEENFLCPFYYQTRYAKKTLVEDSDFQKVIETVFIYQKTPKANLIKQKIDYDLDKFIWEIKEINKPKTLSLGSKKVEIFQKNDYKIIKGKSSNKKLKEIWASGKVLDINSSGRFFRDYLEGRYKKDGFGTLYKVYGIGSDQFGYRYFTGPKHKGATKGKYYQGVPFAILDNLDNYERFTPIVNFANFADSFGNCRHEGGVDFRSGKKPVIFIKHLLKFATSNKEDIILDSFAGSGTTAQAVLDLNKEDGGNRKFILVECENYANKITAERVRRVIKGVPKAKEEKLKKGLGGSFTYCTLGKEINEENLIKGKSLPSYKALSSHVYYVATGQTLNKVNENEDFYIGKTDKETAFFVIYQPNIKFLRSRASALNLDRKEKIQKIMNQKKCKKAVVFASAHYFDSTGELAKEGIIFCQLPFDIYKVAGI